MRGIGVLEDGFVFTDEELERGAPRFWWGLRKRAAYDRVLARRGMSRKGEDERDESDSGSSSSSSAATGATAATAYLVSETVEKKTEGGGSWFGSWGSGDGGSSSSDSGSSDGGSGSDGGGGSGE